MLAKKTDGLLIILDGTGHPVWQKDEWSSSQMETALTEALKYIHGEDIDNMNVDESGIIHNYPASQEASTERE